MSLFFETSLMLCKEKSSFRKLLKKRGFIKCQKVSDQ